MIVFCYFRLLAVQYLNGSFEFKFHYSYRWPSISFIWCFIVERLLNQRTLGIICFSWEPSLFHSLVVWQLTAWNIRRLHLTEAGDPYFVWSDDQILIKVYDSIFSLNSIPFRIDFFINFYRHILWSQNEQNVTSELLNIRYRLITVQLRSFYGPSNSVPYTGLLFFLELGRIDHWLRLKRVILLSLKK